MFTMNKKSKDKVDPEVVHEEELKDPIDGEGSENSESVETLMEEPITEGAGSDIQQEKEKYLRLYSEFENFRRRTTKEKLEMIQNASKDLVVDLLPLIDDFERALKAMRSSGNEAAVEGMELIYKKMLHTLEKRGLKAMVSAGEVFDAELHEAVAQFDAPSEDLKGKVMDELEKGYYLNDKVIRFAKVVVGK
jgi:molecular chaperone GrpE